MNVRDMSTKLNTKRYTAIGFLVWKGGKWYLRRTYLRYLPSRRTAALAGGGALALTGALATHALRSHHEPRAD